MWQVATGSGVTRVPAGGTGDTRVLQVAATLVWDPFLMTDVICLLHWDSEPFVKLK